MSCVFCEIIAERAPAALVRSKIPSVIAFVPLRPVVDGHVLFVPRSHVVDAAENPLRTALTFQAAAEHARERRTAFNLITSAGEAATQTVFHLHIHYVPRRPEDGLTLPWTAQHAAAQPSSHTS